MLYLHGTQAVVHAIKQYKFNPTMLRHQPVVKKDKLKCETEFNFTFDSNVIKWYLSDAIIEACNLGCSGNQIKRWPHAYLQFVPTKTTII